MDLVWRGLPDSINLPRMLAENAALSAAVGASLNVAYSDALVLVRDHRATIDELARRLVEQRALDGDEVVEIVAAKAVSEDGRSIG